MTIKKSHGDDRLGHEFEICIIRQFFYSPSHTTVHLDKCRAPLGSVEFTEAPLGIVRMITLNERRRQFFTYNEAFEMSLPSSFRSQKLSLTIQTYSIKIL